MGHPPRNTPPCSLMSSFLTPSSASSGPCLSFRNVCSGLGLNSKPVLLKVGTGMVGPVWEPSLTPCSLVVGLTQ